MARHVNYSGLVIAGIGFFLTRFTVTLAVYEEPLRFYLAGVLPLALGLGLAAFGVALAVADVDAELVRTTALWCVIGAGTMGVLVVLTLVGSTPGAEWDTSTVRSQTYLSNFLIGGSVGGTLTGLYAARSRRQRVDLERQTRRLEVLNRLLRHEVLNAVTVIRGYAGTDDRDQSRAAIEEYADTIERTIEDVKYLTWSAGSAGTAEEAVAVADAIEASAEGVRARHPSASIDVGSGAEGLAVRADDRLEEVFSRLLENAVVHATGGNAVVDVGVEATAGQVRLSVTDEGPGLPEGQQRLLETGEIEQYDDPGTGFGLNVVRLLVEQYGGEIETDVDDAGTTVTVVLRRGPTPAAGTGTSAVATSATGARSVRPATAELVVTFAAALLAGVSYGVVAEALGGDVAFIGVYYGVASPVVGWLTHEFHSVVFGFVFAGLVSLSPARYRTDPITHVLIGIGWGVTLWALAAGVVSPVWLRLVGIPSTIPTLSPMLLVTHIAWGITIGLLTSVGYRHAVPSIEGTVDRARRALPRSGG